MRVTIRLSAKVKAFEELAKLNAGLLVEERNVNAHIIGPSEMPAAQAGDNLPTAHAPKSQYDS